MLPEIQPSTHLSKDAFLARYSTKFKDFSQVILGDYILSQYTGGVDTPRQITVMPAEEFLGIVINMKKNFRYILNGHPSESFKPHQFNLIYLPARVPCRYILPKEDFTTTTLQCNLSWLEKVETFPLLETFLDKVRRRVPARLLIPHHYVIRTEALDLLNDMQARHDEPLSLRRWIQGIKLEQIILMALDQAKKGFDPAEHHFKCDTEKITAAHQYLTGHLEEPFSMSRLQDVTGLTEYSLQQGFKEMYQLTVFEKLTDDRMQQAKDLLQNTQQTVHNIANTVGYTRRAFIRVFKRKTGLTPNGFRKKTREKKVLWMNE